MTHIDPHPILRTPTGDVVALALITLIHDPAAPAGPAKQEAA